MTNVLIEWLDQVIHGLITLQPFTVCGLLETGRMLFFVGCWNCYVIFENEEKITSTKENTNYEIANVNMIEFCKRLRHDISNNIETWCNWSCKDPYDKRVITEKLNHLK